MKDEELLLLVAGGVILYFLWASQKKTAPQSNLAPGATMPGSSPFGTGGLPGIPSSTSTGADTPPSPMQSGINQISCVNDVTGEVVPANPDGSCPAGSTLTLAIDVNA